MNSISLLAICIFHLVLAQDCRALDGAFETSVDTSAPIRIAIMVDNSPFSLILPNGKPAGLYVDTWKAWSQVTGIEISFVPGSYAENIRSLETDQADFQAGLFINKKREKWAVFSLPIDRVPTSLYFHGDVQDTSSLEQLKGKTISVALGSFQENYLRENYPEINVVTFLDTEETIRQLLNMEIDGIVSESAVVDSRLARLGISGALTKRDEPVLYNTAHALVPKHKEYLLEIINNGINALPIDKMIKIEKKWLPGYDTYFASMKSTLVSSLSIGEQEWLSANNRFVLGVDPAWPPFEFLDENGRYSGISSEYVNLISKRLGVELIPNLGLSWTDVIAKVKQGELDILPGVAASAEREKYLVFSDIYASFPNVVVTRQDAEYIQHLDDLDSKPVVVVEDYVITELLQKNHPKINLKQVQNITEGLTMVQNGQAFAYIDNLAVVTHYINSNRKLELKVAIFTDYDDSLSFGLRKGLEPLVPIINKALASITHKERQTINNSWLSVRLNVGTDFSTIIAWGGPLFLALLSIIMFILRANSRMNEEIKRREIVEIELAEAKDTAERANLLKGDFLANMSHEIRTPMNAVVGMSHLLEKTSLDEEQQGYIETLNNSSASLLLLIDDILDLSKIEVGKLSIEQVPFSLTKLLINVVQQIKIATDESVVTIATDINDSVPKLLVGDGLRLGQILLNLAGNAAKFTPHGNINIRVTVDKKNDTQITLHFVVEDTGIGMSDEQMSRLFQTYSQADSSMTRRYGGTGLGLSICKKLCELMQGKIWVVSEKEKGSQFHFTSVLNYSKSIDVNLADSEEINLIESLQQKDKNTLLKKLHEKRILLVDDNLVNLTIAKKMLNNSGMIVDIAMNGQESLDKLNAYEYDCVLMDIQMPVMDGYQATKLIRESSVYGNIPVIGLSANVMEKDISRGRAAGMDDYLGKPISLEKMLAALSNCLSD